MYLILERENERRERLLIFEGKKKWIYQMLSDHEKKRRKKGGEKNGKGRSSLPLLK